jgi:hypothetical protein
VTVTVSAVAGTKIVNGVLLGTSVGGGMVFIEPGTVSSSISPVLAQTFLGCTLQGCLVVLLVQRYRFVIAASPQIVCAVHEIAQSGFH